jgi:hypothetical protein
MIEKFDTFGHGTFFASIPFDLPETITADKAGSLYVGVWGGLHLNESKVLKVSPSGQVGTYASYFYEPVSLAFDSLGNLYVGAQDDTISKVTPSQQVSYFKIGIGPASMVFDKQNNLYAAAGGVVVLDPNANILQTIPVSGPAGLAFDSSGDLFISDIQDLSILKYDTSGNLSVFARDPDGAEELAFDSSGYLYAVMGNTDTIKKYDQFGNSTVFASGLENPTGIVIVPEPRYLYYLWVPGLVLALRRPRVE